ncbi:MAG: S-layer homology domain-containing protein [Armatimonadetes bacterium]|nr:S-layer homology domain-containing protein [Armatimonadota bacterium]
MTILPFLMVGMLYLAVSSQTLAFRDVHDPKLRQILPPLVTAEIVERDVRQPLFYPDDPVTKGQLAFWLVRVRNLPFSEPEMGRFPDIPKGYKAFREIEAAASREWLTGHEDGNFQPDASISREEFAKFLCLVLDHRYDARSWKQEDIARNLKVGVWSFKDEALISGSFRPWVALALKLQLLEPAFGVNPFHIEEEKTYLHPQRPVSRGEAIKIIVQLFLPERQN